MNKFFGKFLTLYVWLRYPKMPGKFRYFVRLHYLSRMAQSKYHRKDFVEKKPYKVISYDGEFGQELLMAIPFAYWHHCNGTLKKTIACKHTKELYYFSENHEERFTERNWETNLSTEFPNPGHQFKFDFRRWKAVPYAEHYANDFFKGDGKPILVIANRYNTEWGGGPISFFSLEVLDSILKLVYDKYTVYYNRPRSSNIVNDNSEVKELNDEHWIAKNYPNVRILNRIFDENPGVFNNINHAQLMLYANCRNFISVHGGTSTLASNFGGKNLIYSKKGHEHFFGEFFTIFQKLANTTVYHAKTEEQIPELIKENFLEPASHDEA